MSMSSPVARRRSTPTLGHEIRRDRLVAALEARWDLPVVTVVAPAGHGKTTLLAQTVRTNQVAPRGLDAWVGYEPGHDDAATYAAALLTDLDLDPAIDANPLVAVVQAIQAQSPLDVCVLLDDLHRLDPGSSAVELVAGLLRDLPANGHLVLSGRDLPPLPLSRFRAADDVLDLGPEQLRFTTGETSELAAAFDRKPESVAGLGGWPALVRLALTAPEGTTERYLWEEVVGQLDPADREVLVALTTVGQADGAILGELLGRPVDVAELPVRIPLLHLDGGGTVRAHQLWEDALTEVVPAEEIEPVRRRAIAVVDEADDPVRLGTMATRFDDVDALCRAATRLIRGQTGGEGVETGRRWWAAASERARAEPAVQLLDVWSRMIADVGDPEALALVDRLLPELEARRDHDGQAVAIAMAVIAAIPRNDLGAILTMAERARTLPDADRDPFLANLLATTDASLADLGGDTERGLAILTDHLARTDIDLNPVASHLLVQLLVKLGRADDAVEAADAAARRHREPGLQTLPAYTRFLAGDPSGYSSEERDQAPEAGASTRWRFEASLVATVFRACGGFIEELEVAWDRVERLRPDPITADLQAGLAVAGAYRSIANHDEAAARDALARLVVEHDATGREVDHRLRAFLAVPHVLVPELRDQWDRGPMGPVFERNRSVGDLLVRARAGTLDRRADLPAGDHVYTCVPLPWSVELAARAAAGQNRQARRMAEELVDRSGASVHRELQWLVDHGDDVAADGAQRLLAAVPVPPDETMRIEVLGPLRLAVDGRTVERPELRRARVRQLLTLLTIEPEIDRYRVMALLWSDRDPDAAARNLRVTLSHLRRLLEPDRRAGQASFHLRVDGTRIQLVRSPNLEVDLWEFGRHESAARPERAADLWRGPVLGELTDLDPVRADVEAVHLRMVDTTLRAGELALAAGSPDLAAQRSERVVAVEPLNERAHRLAIAAHLQRADAGRTAAALERARAALDDLGAQPDPATLVLERQARTRFDLPPTFA